MTAHDRSALENEWKKCFERALREMIGKRPGKIDLYKANIACIDLLNAEKNRLAGIKQKIEEHANIEEISYSTIKRYASDFISMIRAGNVKMLPAMAKGLLDGDEYTLFSHADKFPAIEDAFENFAVLPMYMRALLWYTYEGRKKNVCEGMLEAATKVANKVAEMEELNATGQSYLEATKKAKTNIETAFAQIKRAYNEDKIKRADYLNVYKPLAEEMIAELESFISIWEGFI